ncbi:aldehyde dehydrogenase family protein, partial [Janibacter sp. RAF20_2_2]
MTQPRTLRNFIGGEYVDATGDASIDLVNPATGQVVAHAPVSTQADVDAAYASAEAGFAEWSEATPGERQSALLKFADALEARADDLIRLEGENTGKPHALTATEEVPVMCDQLRFFAGAARVLEGRASAEYMKGHTSWIRREPIGVVGQVTPWNYPMMMATWKIGPALAAGNSIVLKPSDTTPETTLLMAEIASEFLPAGTFNVITGDRDTGRMVVEHDTPGLVAITGSVRAGIEVAASAARNLKRAHLELGGKAPVVVFDDADIEAAVEGIATAGYFNAGQDCTAAT